MYTATIRLKIPGLQRLGHCVVCGERADSFCAACGVTPYCSPACQRRDWSERHRKVCHNLKRVSGAGGDVVKPRQDVDAEPVVQPAVQLRRPRTPEPRRERPDDGEDKMPSRKFGPPGASNSAPSRGGYRGTRGGHRPDDRADKPHRSSDYNRNHEGFNRKQDNDAGDRDDQDRKERSEWYRQGLDGGRNERTDGRKPQGETIESRAKPEPKPEEPMPKPSFKPKPAPELVEPKLQPKAAPEAKATPVPKPVVVTPAAPVRELVPKNCLIDLLKENDTVTLSVDAAGGDCRAGAGWVCVSLHPEYSEQYMLLLDDAFTQGCEASAVCERKPGVTFAYLNPQDKAWYRARFLTPSLAALLDASKLVPVTPADQCRALPAAYTQLPEFCCRLQAGDVQISDNVTCTILAKNKDSVAVSIVNNVTEAPLGRGTVGRWQPEVEYPAPEVPAAGPAKPAGAANAANAAVIPEVPRPPVTNNSKVVLIDATEPDRLFVRGASLDLQKQFDEILTEVAVYGDTATPLKEPPVKGQTVVAKFADGVHYRALCRRVNSKLNKYLLEYIEYGNTEVRFLEDLYPCPAELDLPARPTLAARAALPCARAFTAAAQALLDRLKNDGAELTLTIPSGERTAPSGATVRLCVCSSGEDVGRAVEELCTPEWARLQARGGDVAELEPLYYKDIEYVKLPAAGCELEVVDTSLLAGGVLTGFQRGAPHAARAFALAAELAEYCNSPLCKDPYLPRTEELCVAFCPKKQQWLRAMLLQQNGPGSDELDVLLFDYGHLAPVRAPALRKMPPGLVRARPAAVCSLEIRDFPKEPTPEQLTKALRHLNLNEAGRGFITVTRAEQQDLGDYLVDAPDLLRAIGL